MQATKRAVLILADGTRYNGHSFGFEGSTSGEVVFSTAMTGYPESLTDPSYEGQILISTFSQIGNYGVPPQDDTYPSHYYESKRIHCRAIVALDYTPHPSHWLSDRTLADWLKEQKVLGIYGIDTRALTKHLREHGTMLGKIIIEDCEDVDFYDPHTENLIAQTSCSEPITLSPEGSKTVVLVDCGVKHSILRALQDYNLKVVCVPWDYDFNTIPHDGIIISNGPGNPDFADKTIANIKTAFAAGKPILGICLGNLLMAKASGANTYKLKYGHHGHNQPVRQNGTTRCFITNQNHSYAVDANTLPTDWETSFTNMNDESIEGIHHSTLPYLGVQFNPCSSDTKFILDEFVASL